MSALTQAAITSNSTMKSSPIHMSFVSFPLPLDVTPRI